MYLVYLGVIYRNTHIGETRLKNQENTKPTFWIYNFAPFWFSFCATTTTTAQNTEKTQKCAYLLNGFMYLHKINTKVGEHANVHAHQFWARYNIPFSKYCQYCQYTPLYFRSEKVKSDNLRPITPEPLIGFIWNFARAFTWHLSAFSQNFAAILLANAAIFNFNGIYFAF